MFLSVWEMYEHKTLLYEHWSYSNEKVKDNLMQYLLMIKYVVQYNMKYLQYIIHIEHNIVINYIFAFVVPTRY